MTWPSGLQAPAMDTDGDPGCLDYVWVRGAVAVETARLVVRPAGGRRPDALPVATTSGSQPALRVGG